MKKKSFRKLVSLFTLACIMSASLVLPVQAATLNPVTSTPKVSEMLNNVLSSELEIVKTSKSKDYSSVINESKLLQSIQKEEKYKENWYNDINFKIYDYTSNVKVNNVTQLSDKKYELDITFQAELILSKDLQIHPKMSEDYVCEIENRSGQWVINKLIDKVDYQDIVKEGKSNNNTMLANDSVAELTSADILANNDMILDAKINDLKTKSTNIDASVKNYKEMMKQTKNTLSNGSEKATPSYAGTNRAAVANYAVTYGINHNSNYTYISGADCTNFVSQAVKAGGVPTNSTWNPYTTAWVNVVSFYSYMVNNGYASGSSIHRGDVIQWKRSYLPVYSHSTVATYLSDTYGWLLSAHSSDRSNYPMSMYYSDFSSYRDMYFW